MLYQKMLVGKHPYIIAVGDASPFECHRHPEIELSYCLEGEYCVVIEGRKQCLCAGDLLVLNHMTAHEFPKGEPGTATRLTIELGPLLLGDYFDAFSEITPRDNLLRLREENESRELCQELDRLLVQTAELHTQKADFFGLEIQGNLYKISALILRILGDKSRSSMPARAFQEVDKIEQALQSIYDRYYENLDLETMSQMCGYGKSNFCKVFKRIAGDTFHNILTRHRVEIACLHLKESASSVEQIATMVGFTDAKSFCRAFKKITGETPGGYRKKRTKRKKQ